LVWGFGGIIITEKKGEKSPQCVIFLEEQKRKHVNSYILYFRVYTSTLNEP